MQIKLLATGQGPDYYTVSGEVVTAHLDGASEAYDLSAFPEGGVFQGADTLNGTPAIRGVERVAGELRVTLCQQVGPGHWSESDWIDAAAYDPDAVQVVLNVGKEWAGEAWVKTGAGIAYYDPQGQALLTA